MIETAVAVASTVPAVASAVVSLGCPIVAIAGAGYLAYKILKS